MPETTDQDTRLDSPLSVRLRPAIRADLQALARARELSEADIIRAAIRFYLKTQARELRARRELEPA